jgi:hypothetical protein
MNVIGTLYTHFSLGCVFLITTLNILIAGLDIKEITLTINKSKNINQHFKL